MPKNTPKLRFKGFSEPWPTMRLGEVCELIKDGTHGSHFDMLNGVPLLSAKDINNGIICIPNDCRRISEEDFQIIHSSYRLQNDDILLTIVGTIGRCALVENYEKNIFTLQRSVAILRTKPLYLAKMILHLIRSNYIQKILDRNKSVSAQPGIYLGDLADIIVTLPPNLAEQTQIGEYFKSLDALISLRQSQYDKLLAVKQACLAKMFPKQGATKPQLRFKGFSEPWETMRLGDVFKYERPDPYIVKSDKYFNLYKTPVLTANKSFILGYTNEENTYKDPSIIFDDFTLESRLVKFPYMVKSSAIKILTVRDKYSYNLDFVFEVLNSIKIEVLGHARHYISVVQPTQVPLPNLAEQTKIGEYFKKLDHLISLRQVELEKLKNIKKACLAQMFV
ncbi:MAG: restriction endonuclease subunit S [Brevinema sp.]